VLYSAKLPQSESLTEDALKRSESLRLRLDFEEDEGKEVKVK